MAGGIVSIKCRIDVDKFDILTADLRQSTSDGVYDAMVQARDAVRPLTPFDPKHRHGGPHLNQPEIHRYDNGTVSMQWRANNKGFYYAGIQNDDYSLNHPHGGGPGFINQVYEGFSQNAPEIITNLMHSKGW